MTTTQKQIIETFVKDSIKTIGYLYSRWLDESEFENINDYQKPLEKHCNQFNGIKITKMTKRPFGFHFTLNDSKFVFSVKPQGMGWKVKQL